MGVMLTNLQLIPVHVRDGEVYRERSIRWHLGSDATDTESGGLTAADWEALRTAAHQGHNPFRAATLDPESRELSDGWLQGQPFSVIPATWFAALDDAGHLEALRQAFLHL